jgi:hypothetical protein
MAGLPPGHLFRRAAIVNEVLIRASSVLERTARRADVLTFTVKK